MGLSIGCRVPHPAPPLWLIFRKGPGRTFSQLLQALPHSFQEGCLILQPASITWAWPFPLWVSFTALILLVNECAVCLSNSLHVGFLFCEPSVCGFTGSPLGCPLFQKQNFLTPVTKMNNPFCSFLVVDANMVVSISVSFWKGDTLHTCCRSNEVIFVFSPDVRAFLQMDSPRHQSDPSEDEDERSAPKVATAESWPGVRPALCVCSASCTVGRLETVLHYLLTVLLLYLFICLHVVLYDSCVWTYV